MPYDSKTVFANARLVLAAVRLGTALGDMAAGFAAVAAASAAAAGYRGRIAPGLRADLARVRSAEGLPLPCGVWAAGEWIA